MKKSHLWVGPKAQMGCAAGSFCGTGTPPTWAIRSSSEGGIAKKSCSAEFMVDHWGYYKVGS